MMQVLGFSDVIKSYAYPLWVVNADLFVEYNSAGFVPKWLSDMMMLGKDLIF